MRGSIRLRVVASEAWRDIRTGTSRVLIVALGFALCAGLLAGLDMVQAAQLIGQSQRYVQSGASTYTLTAAGNVDGATCDRLASLDGVLAAGAVRQNDERLRFAVLPSTGIPTYEITPGAVDIFESSDSVSSGGTDGTSGGGGILLSRQVADTLGARADGNESLKTEDDTAAGDAAGEAQSSAHVRGVYDWPEDGRDSQYSYAAMVPVNSSQPFDVCLVKAWPIPDDLPMLIRLATLDATNENSQPKVGQLNASLGSQAPTSDGYRTRLTSFAPYVMLAVGLLLGFLPIRLRRLELASALHCGWPRAAQMAQIWLETLAAALGGIVVVLPLFFTVPFVLARTGGSNGETAGGIASAASPADLAALLDSMVRVPVAGLAGLLLGAFAATALTRESQLFAYFKKR